MGAENYELGAKTLEVRFLDSGPGIAIASKKPVLLEADTLLGDSYECVTIHDVRLVTDVVTLPLAKLGRNEYPKVLRKGDQLELF